MSQVLIPTSNCGAWKFALCLTITSAVFDVLVKLAIHVLPWLTVKPRESNRVLWHWSCISLWQIDVVGTGRNGNSLKSLWWCWCLMMSLHFCSVLPVQFLYESYMQSVHFLKDSSLSTLVKYSNHWQWLTSSFQIFPIESNHNLWAFWTPRTQEGPEAALKGHLAASSWSRIGLCYHAHLVRAKNVRFSGSGTRPNKIVFYCHLSFSSKALQPLACVFPRKWNAPNRRQLISNDTPVLF